MPSCTLPIARYAQIPPESRPQRRGIPRVDARTRKGRLLREVRKTPREHLGSNPTAVDKALIERAAWRELAIGLSCNGARRIRSGRCRFFR
jgi:hypothetical protein